MASSLAPAPIAIGVEQLLHLHIFMAAKGTAIAERWKFC